MTVGVRSTTCMCCQGKLDPKTGELVPNRAFMTDWTPTFGLDPLLREFKCETCGHCTYQRVRPAKIPGEPDDGGRL
jgi:hypothetical protein